MGADELNHIKRADMVGQGRLIGERAQRRGEAFAGGPVEANVNRAEAPYHGIEFHPDVKVDPNADRQARAVPWDDQVEWQSFENTAIYPPTFYLPAAAAIDLGKALGLDVIQTLEVARGLNALCCTAVGFVALLLAGQARFLLFTGLTLPMTLMQFATVTQDGLLLASCALACALIARARGDGRALSAKETWAVTTLLILIGMAKPPYALFSLLLLCMQFERPRLKWVAFSAALGMSLAWHLAITALVQAPTHRPEGIPNMSAQAHDLLANPTFVFTVAKNTLVHSGGEYAAQVIGVLGWLDTLLPKSYYVAAYLVLIVAAVVTWAPKPARWLAIILILGLVKLTVYGALYLSYTGVGAPQVDGVQGRYFLPVLLLVPLALIGPGKPQPSHIRSFGIGLVLLFPIVSLFLVDRALTHRYY